MASFHLVYTNSLLSSLNLRQALRNSEMISTLSGFNVDIQRSTVTTVDDETETRGKGSKVRGAWSGQALANGCIQIPIASDLQIRIYSD